MLTHTQIWGLIDWLAARNGLTPSGLARRAGLDPTTFNRSKRTAVDGRQRWPSTESLAKVLEATNTPLQEFSAMAIAVESRSGPASAAAKTPPMGFADDGGAGSADGHAGDGTLTIRGAAAAAPALSVDPDAMPHVVPVPAAAAGPLYRSRDQLIVVRVDGPMPGDRVLVRMTDGADLVGEVASVTETALHLEVPGHAEERIVERSAVASLLRILWVSQ
ncbi:helix-turn-helix transcriptional regulator [Mongoliimonas terrestris]|uniref:helix-turn-helix transcriptional regulator n=1 Tax=Mongoliimonas terrestris TaxID=1709001 RepID=UPI0009498273|nr:helix-turn-helix transcriptional regulator [Mongoliimonas terrestris]